jgi:hypothetical protein
VGRTNQRVDFMWLRPRLPTDPRLWITYVGHKAPNGEVVEFTVSVWAERGSVTARQLTFRVEPPIGTCTATQPFLPNSDGNHSIMPTFRCGGQPFTHASADVIATCEDDWGCRWEFRQKITLAGSRYIASVGLGTCSSRRILELPAIVGSGTI